MSTIRKKRVALFATLLISLFVVPLSLYSSYIYEGDDIINKKTLAKMKEMGDELFAKTGVSTVVVAKKHLDQNEFLEIKNRYLKELHSPFVLWIFSRTYMDRKDIGLNQMFKSSDMNDRFDESSLFSPFSGTFTKIISIPKSKTDVTSAAFLNGYADLVDMIADSYGIKLDSSIGSQSKEAINVTRVVFYAVMLFFALWFLKNRFLKGN